MRTKAIYLLFIGVLLVSITAGSCKKIENKDRKLYGRLIDSVTSEPISTTSFMLFSLSQKQAAGSKLSSFDEYSFATDANGHFSVVFRSETGKLYIMHPGEEPLSSAMPVWTQSIGDNLEYNAGEIRTRKQ